MSQQELFDISRETRTLMGRVMDGDRNAMDRILQLSKRREEILCARPATSPDANGQGNLVERRVKALSANRTMSQFVNGASHEKAPGGAALFIALGFVLGLMVSLLIHLLT